MPYFPVNENNVQDISCKLLTLPNVGVTAQEGKLCADTITESSFRSWLMREAAGTKLNNLLPEVSHTADVSGV